ncbi:APC family permease [Nocardioides pocheonensis]|uniref:APC family permease n=1 Tax=Nocardioides pocheonensis TaxID=661485 RepID=A0A3N0GHU7_9ACTN|nr:APC family permease [Nocardioides pocheonensis]RNM12035.1 APC family permease [Nocardioides pocheonensis]
MSAPTTPGQIITDEESPRLHGNMGSFELFFSIMAYNAPLVVIIGVIPVMLIVGNGVGTPLVFIISGLILAAFADGFIRMSKALPRPGAFYSFISAGLGREVGLGAGLVMLGAYYCVAVGTIAFGGIVLGALVTDTLHGPDAPWWIWGAVFWAVAGILGYLRIDVSARITAGLLFLELIVVAVYDLGVSGRGGASGLSSAPFSPGHLFDGSFSIGILLAMGMFGGFEVAVLFRDEVRDPDRTIPRATYGVIAAAGILYSVTAWLFINAVGVDHVVALVTGDPEGVMHQSLRHFGGRFAADSANVLVNTSSFAVLLCAHNVGARYAFNLSADGIFPRALSGIHKTHGSPHVSSVVFTIASAVIFVPVLILGIKPLAFYAAILGIASITALLVFFLSNAAVMRYMRKEGSEESAVHRVVLPVVAAVGLGATIALGVKNFTLLTGGSQAVSNLLLVVIAATLLGGIALAFVYRRTRPEVYQRIGRQ